MKDFRQLKVWEDAHELTLTLYELTAAFPKHELFAQPDPGLCVLHSCEHR